MLSRIIGWLRTHGRACAFGLALAALANGLTAVVLAGALNMDACHLCIFQRLIFFLIGAVLLIVSAGWKAPPVRNASLAATDALRRF